MVNLSMLTFKFTLLLALTRLPLIEASSRWATTCNRIASRVSSASGVFFPESAQYQEDISHYSVAVVQNATCSVEPGTVSDVSTILRILGETRTPFAVKGGGHATNPGFSATEGVQISMTRFSEIQTDNTSQTVDLGAGLIWDNVYPVLDAQGVGVLGGRTPGIGVAGYILGGGYAWQSNEHGLAIDSVQAYELVLPNGDVQTVTEESNPDLFFGLKGGFNNFGIVTKFTLATFPQSQIWGGLIVLLGDDAVNALVTATATFCSQVTDPKAAAIISFAFSGGQSLASAILFYGGPMPPAGIFDDFLAIPALSTNVTTQTESALLESIGTTSSNPFRAVYNTAPFLEYTPSMVAAVANESLFWGQRLGDSATLVSNAIEPFLPTLLTHGSPSAYPPTRDHVFLPMSMNWEWTSPEVDNVIQDATRQSVAFLTKSALAAGQDIANASLYGNYAIFGTPLSQIYGDNVERLKIIKEKYDPENVMGLTGGWKF